MAQAKVRSVFFFNSQPVVGDSMGLHFFEPRYRLLVQRALARDREFVFLPNFADYQASHGDIGYIVTIVGHRPMPGANPNELPRADVQLRFEQRCLVLFHWIESGTGGLTECLCSPIDNNLPALEDTWPRIAVEPLHAAINTAAAADMRVFSSAPHQHPELPHYVLHAHSHAQAEVALTSIEEEVAGARGLIYPAVTPPVERTIAVTNLIRRLASLALRMAESNANTTAAPEEASDAAADAAAGGSSAAAAAVDVSAGDERGDGPASPASAGSPASTGSPSSPASPGGELANGSTRSSTRQSGQAGDDERAAAAFRALSLKELRERLYDMRISLSASCLEKEDL